MLILILNKRDDIANTLVLKRHISRMHFPIENSRTRDNSTSLIIVCHSNFTRSFVKDNISSQPVSHFI